MNIEKIKAVQRALGVVDDGIWGKKSQAALEAILKQDGGQWHTGKASSFADPADVRAFRLCKDRGGSDNNCFRVGDNGIGKWGDDTTANIPMCALPPEDWQHLPSPRGALVRVNVGSLEVLCQLRDTMPHKANIKNGAVIDLNPAACSALGLTPPIMVNARWQWA